MDQISWEDKELTIAGTWFLEVATHQVHVWALDKMYKDGKKSNKVKSVFNDEKKIKAAAAEIYENFLDDCFGNQSRVYRETFIEEVEKNCKYLFKPEELREKIIAQIEDAPPLTDRSRRVTEISRRELDID